MKMQFIGAISGSVTGSCTHFHYSRTGARFLVDCGMVQGEGDFESINSRPFPFDASAIEFVLLTHAHLDHCGLLPKLYNEGFAGEVICTAATARLAQLSLTDSARAGGLFSKDDVKRVRFKPIEENSSWAQPSLFPVRKDLFVGFRRTAHIMGSCSVTVGWLDDKETKRYLVMSGDLGNNVKGNPYQPLLSHRKGVLAFPDAIVVESTYGDRVRDAEYKSFEVRIEALRKLIQQEVMEKKAVLVFPAFSLQRTQELLLDLYVVLKRHFADASNCLAPYSPPNRFRDIFEDEGWDEETERHLGRAIHDLPEEERERWAGVINTDEPKPSRFRLAPDCPRTLNELRELIQTRRHPYPIDIVLDSSLARAMGAVMREELFRRSSHKTAEFAHRNPELMARLGAKDEDEFSALLCGLMPDARGEDSEFSVGPHVFRFKSRTKVPGPRASETRGTILLTGGGMCEGGPVVAHLEALATQERESVLVKTGYMPRYTLGGRLTALGAGEPPPNGIGWPDFDIGDMRGVPASSIHLRAFDLSPYYSGHADQDGLLDFVFAAGAPSPEAPARPATVFINHGNPQARDGLRLAVEARKAERRAGDRAVDAVELPSSEAKTYDLVLGAWVTQSPAAETASQTLAPILQALLREQMRTNELLQRLLEAQAQPRRPQQPNAPKHHRNNKHQG